MIVMLNNLIRWKPFSVLILALVVVLGAGSVSGCRTAKQKYNKADPYTGFGVWYLGSWVGVNHFYTPALKTEVVFQENGEVIWKNLPDPDEDYQRIKKDKKTPVPLEELEKEKTGKIVDPGNVILFPDGSRRLYSKEPQERLRITLEDTFQGSILFIRKPSRFP